MKKAFDFGPKLGIMTAPKHLRKSKSAMELLPQDLLIIAIALAIGGLVKGITGIGMPIIAIPIMAEFLGVEHSVLIMIPSIIIMNGWLVWSQRADAKDVAEMPALLAYGCVGVIGGSWILFAASERLLATILALWIGVYILIRLLHPSMSFSLQTRHKLTPVVGSLAGIFQGATGISAPILATYLHALRLRPGAYVFAVATPFAVLALAQFLTYVWFEMYTQKILLESGLVLLPALITIPLGARIRTRIDQQLFDHMIMLLIGIMGVRLIYNVWVTA